MTTTGYAITCPECHDDNAVSIPEVESVPGDDTTIVRYTHAIQCPTCDILDTPTRG